MNVTKRVVLLLLLAVVGSNADTEPEPTTGPDQCDGLKNKIPVKDLHKLNGEWVLFWSVSNFSHGQEMLSVLRTSHVEIHSDNTTFIMTERNLYTSSPNRRDFFINETLPSGHDDHDDHDDHSIHADTVIMEADGARESYNDSGHLTFYETCPDCMLMIYQVTQVDQQFLLIYKKDGTHRDPEKVKTAHEDHKKQAECLGFSLDKPYSYDGVADFAHKKSAPEDPVAEQS